MGYENYDFNLNDVEMDALDELATQQDMSKTAILRQALRLYQLITINARTGWELDFVDTNGRSHRQVMGQALLGIVELPKDTPRPIPDTIMSEPLKKGGSPCG